MGSNEVSRVIVSSLKSIFMLNNALNFPHKKLSIFSIIVIKGVCIELVAVLLIRELLIRFSYVLFIVVVFIRNFNVGTPLILET